MQSPLTDSKRRPPPYHVPGGRRHALLKFAQSLQITISYLRKKPDFATRRQRWVPRWFHEASQRHGYSAFVSSVRTRSPRDASKQGRFPDSVSTFVPWGLQRPRGTGAVVAEGPSLVITVVLLIALYGGRRSAPVVTKPTT